MAHTILAAVEDLFFLARIEETARRVGASVEAVKPAQLEERLAQGPAPAIILDLNCTSCSAVDLLRALRANPATHDVPVLGFVSHVQSELIVAAREAGCDTVLARSAFTQRLPQLLLSLIGHQPGSKAGAAAE